MEHQAELPGLFPQGLGSAGHHGVTELGSDQASGCQVLYVQIYS